MLLQLPHVRRKKRRAPFLVQFWMHALNLTDEKYATRVTASSGVCPNFPGNPRTVFVGLSYQWGGK